MTRRLVGLAHGPETITLVRHAESVGNVADTEARRRESDRLDLPVRDADVELSDTGREQADALGRYLEQLAPDERPTMVLTSPFERAAATASRALASSDLDIVPDERLRERDLGQFDGLTGTGIRHLYAEEAERRKKVGKFYYQPPGGESWADVVLRVRSLLADLRDGFEDVRLWIFTHQAVVMSFRYALEGIDEAQLLEIDRTVQVPNCSLTTYDRSPDGPRLRRFADTVAVAGEAASVTDEASETGQAANRD